MSCNRPTTEQNDSSANAINTIPPKMNNDNTSAIII